MNDLDQMIRQSLTMVMDQAPMAPSVSQIMAQSDRIDNKGHDRRLLVLAAGLVMAMLIGVGAWGRSGEELIATGSVDPAVQTTQVGAPSDELPSLPEIGGSQSLFGEPVELDLGRFGQFGPNSFGVRMVPVGTGVLAASSYGSGDSWHLDIALLTPGESEVEEVLSEETGGVLVALEAEGDLVMAVASEHFTNRLPLVMLSFDGGASWIQHEMPSPSGSDSSSKLELTDDNAGPYAAWSAAIGDGTLLVTGPTGVWVSEPGDEWEWVQLTDDGHLTASTWDGAEFVVAGGVSDPIKDGDENVVLWRSANGRDWSSAETPNVDPLVRTADGPGVLASPGEGVAVTLTHSQAWVGNEAGSSGTLVITSRRGEPSRVAVWPGRYTDSVAMTPWGLVVATNKLGSPDGARLWATTDGIEWNDIGATPVLPFSMAPWGDGLLLFGSPMDPELGDQDRPGIWYLPPADGQPVDTPSTEPEFEAQSLPIWFDPATAAPILAQSQPSVFEAAQAYFSTALDMAHEVYPSKPVSPAGVANPEPPEGIFLSLADAVELAETTLAVPWTRPQRGSSGTLVFRRSGTSWSLVGVFSEGLDLVDLRREGGLVSGSVLDRTSQGSYLDVFGADGNPVPGASRPDGYFPGGDFIFGSVGGEGGARLDFEVADPGGPLRIRAVTVGGAVLSVTEVVLE